MPELAVNVSNLSFAYSYKENVKQIFTNISLSLPLGCRSLLIGANGVGKSTLLKLISGAHLITQGSVKVLDREAFHCLDLSALTAIVNEDFPLNIDISVQEILEAPSANIDSRREKELISLLGINPEWRMSRVSEGQKRRVQLLLSLRRKIKILLLDEVTAHLDIVTRADFLSWLKRETENHNLSVIYATHIFDGLMKNDSIFPTHVVFIGKNSTIAVHSFEKMVPEIKKKSLGLDDLFEKWIRQDLEHKS